MSGAPPAAGAASVLDMLVSGPHLERHPLGFGEDVASLYRRGISWRPALAAALLLCAMLAGCGPSHPDRPHVLLVIVSGARPDHMSAYGYGRATTPALQKLAASGTLFESAITTAPWSLTAQASILT